MNTDILKQKIDPKKLLNISEKENRNDNKAVILKFFPNLEKNNFYKNIYNELSDIENELTKNKLWFMNSKNLHSVYHCIKYNKFGLLKLPKSKLIFTHFLIKNDILRHIDFQPNLNLLMKNDESKTGFESYSLNENFLENSIKYYLKRKDNIEKYFPNIINILDKYINFIGISNSQNLGMNILEYIIKYLFNKKSHIENEYYFIKNNEGKTLFHLISQYDDCDCEIIQKIIFKYEELKRQFTKKKLGKLLSQQDINGVTILMNCLKSNQIKLALKIIDDLGDYLNFFLYDIQGNTILHYLFLNKKDQNLIKKGQLEIILNICSKILKKNSELIKSQNFDGYTPWLLAAKAGIPGALFLMSKYYLPEKIEEYSINTSAIHEAATSNKKKILRYLIEYFRYDINSKLVIQENKNYIDDENYFLNKKCDNIVPLHFAASSYSLKSFKFLIEMGANPFIKNNKKLDSISILLRNGNKINIDFIINTRIFKANFYNGKYLFDLLTNNLGAKYIIKYIIKNGFQIDNLSNKNCQNLFLLACGNDNIDIMEFLLKNKININIGDILDNKAIHYLACNNAINCGYLFFKYLEQFHKGKILNYIFAKNKIGNTPFHICCLENSVDFLYILIEFTKKHCKDIQFERNNDGLKPIQIALYNQNYECAKLLYNLFNLKDSEITQCGDEYKHIIIKNFESKKEMIIESDIKTDFEKFFKNKVKIKGISRIKSSNKSTYDIFYEKISKYYKLKKCNKNIYLKYESIFGHPTFLDKLYELARNDLGEVVDFFFEIINLKIDMNKAFKKLVKFYIGFIFVNCEYKDFPDILNNLEYVLFSYLKNLDNNHPIFDWIQSIIISYYSYQENICTNFILSLIKKFIDIINQLNLIDAIKFTNIPDISYRFIYNLLKIINDMDQQTAYIQVKRMNMIPPLLITEIKELKNKYNIINSYAFSENPLHKFCSIILKIKNISPLLIDSIIEFTIEIEKSDIIMWESKIRIIEFFCNKFDTQSDINLNNYFEYFEKVISFIGNPTFIKEIIPAISKKEISYNNSFEVIQNLSFTDNINIFRKKLEYLKKNNLKKFNEIQRDSFYNKDNLLEIIENFKTVNLFNTEKINALPEEDIEQLHKFGILIQNSKKYSKYELKSKAQEFGKLFRSSHTLENLANLFSVIISGFVEIMKIKPYLIQILSVASFCLYFIDNNKKNHLKGRLAQIATGEGKTIIIVILALVTSLQGYFTDIITPNAYLAKFAYNKYKDLYNSFGITSDHVTNEMSKNFNSMVIYGTNTDFEFTILREGINLYEVMVTERLENKKMEKRIPEVVIVDEVDNLFIDKALNYAMISYSSRINYTWVYKPIYNFILSTKENEINNDNLKKYFETYNNGEYFQKIKNIDNDKINDWIKMCKKAISLKININYIVKNKKVYIIEKATGRISKSTRWTHGLHEFVEVKEKLIPENESATIASMSHYSFYNRYKIIFGLTGTIGTENEKNEIKLLYKLDNYDIPTNFQNKRKIMEPIILDTKEEKLQKIKDEIIKYKKEKRPSLVLFKNIEETLQFSDTLNKENINHKLLNDIQMEDEDSILYYGKKPGSIIIATIVAGRGTDIVLNKESIKNGGLHVIIGFLPKNRRIEFQCVGRAGRQGQPGTSQMIISRDEKMVKKVSNYYNNLNEKEKEKFKSYNDNQIEYIFSYREYKNNLLSMRRIFYINNQALKYEILLLFFESLKKLSEMFDNNSYKVIIIDSKKYNHSDVKHKIIEDYRIDWSTYFSDIIDRNIPKISPNKLFWKFLVQYEWEYIKNPVINQFLDFVKEKYNNK